MKNEWKKQWKTHWKINGKSIEKWMEKAMKNEWKSNEMRSIGHWPIDLRWRSIGRWPIDLRLTAAARSQWSAAGWPLKINGKALKNQGNGACKRQMAATKWQWLPFAKWQPLPFAIDLRRNRPPQWSARGGALRSASLHAYRLSSACTRTGSAQPVRVQAQPARVQAKESKG